MPKNKFMPLIAGLLWVSVSLYPSLLMSTDSSALEKFYKLEESSLLVIDPAGNEIRKLHPDKPMIPASTLKLLTGLLALETWGENYRFVTDFAIDQDNYLWVKGYGDPFLISEEIDRIVAGLKKKGLKVLRGVGVDDSYFSANIIIDGQSETDNPYDAPLAALAANFNTINIRRKNQETISAEIQTPVTPLMKQLAKKLPSGVHRINLGQQLQSSQLFAEILIEKLKQQGIRITTNRIIRGQIPDTLSPFYRHQNSHDLSNVISAMLKYSNNFVANQLFLLLGVEKKGVPASMEKSSTVIEKEIDRLFGWKNYRIIEGAGLSRNNRLSARQLIDILQRFTPYRMLLNRQNARIMAKSGTLQGISTYAGYLFRSNQWMPFALLINQPVEYDLRKRLALELLQK